MSRALNAHFSEYASFHVTRGNQTCHYVGIPLIILTHNEPTVYREHIKDYVQYLNS